MATLEPILIDFIFENGGILKEEILVEEVSKLIDLEKEKITKSINKLISKNKLYQVENNYISLTDFGDTQENKINDLLKKIVYGKFLFLNPKLKNSKEFCDNMIFFDGVLIIFQSKTKDYTKIEEFDRFRKKCIDSAINQLNVTLNWARNDSVEKKFLNNFGEEIEIKSGDIKKIIGICVSYFHADKDYFITKGNTLNLKNKEEIPNILTYQELKKIIEFNDTFPEFVEYLDKRRILVQKNVPLLSERQVLSYFFSTNRTMIPPSMTPEEFEKSSMIILTDDFEESLNSGDLFKKLNQRTKKNEESYFIDTIINKILPKAPKDTDKFLVELINLNRFNRRLIAENVLPAYKEFIQRKQDFRAPFISLGGSCNYLFLFSRKLQDMKVNEEMLKFYTVLIKNKHNLDKIIGISENHYSNGLINHNFCAMEGDVKFEKENLPEEIKKMMEDKSKVTEKRDLYEFD
jgi:hypothetical protein